MKTAKHKTKFKWEPSHWAALSLLIGLVACLVWLVYVIYNPTDVDIINVVRHPMPEAPYVAPSEDHVDTGSMLDRIWASTVWIGREVRPGVNQYIGTGWVIGNKGDTSYIVTCAHVATHRKELPLNIGYLGRSGQWSTLRAEVVMRLDGRAHGDLALLSVDMGDLVLLPPIKFSKIPNTYAVGDEILISGVQYNAPPAIIAAGVITKIDPANHKFEIKGWDWYGFSGGPIILKKTGLVIGYTAMSADGHLNDAMKSQAFDLTHLPGLLKACKLEEFIKE